MLKRNVVANYLGQGWAALMGFAFIPLYVRCLGMEAYGLVGLFAVMQAWLALLDLGMTPTLNREMARFTAGAHSAQSIRELLHSAEIICFGLAALAALSIWAGSDYLATDWLHVDRLPKESVAEAVTAMAFVIALRFCEGIYRGSLFGLQRQVWCNAANASLATLRFGGAAVVLVWVSPSIQAFFFWQGLVSLLSVSVLSRKVHGILPRGASVVSFRWRALTGVWRFAGGMVCISCLAILLTQIDKVLLSRLIPLEDFGYYTLAATVSAVLTVVVGPVAQAVYPRMVEHATRRDQPALIGTYHLGAQLVTVLTTPAGLVLCLFARDVVFVWSGDAALASNTAPILSVLALGNLLNGLVTMPHFLQITHSWTSLGIKTNIVAVCALVPAIFWIVPTYGAIGAAWIWVCLNIGYALVGVPLMHRRLIPDEKWRWYGEDILLPAAAAAAAVVMVRFLFHSGFASRMRGACVLALAGCSAMLFAATMADHVRSRVRRLVRGRASIPGEAIL